jgi:hypothetical protein
LWEAFLDTSDSYFPFADLVGFYTHWTYILGSRNLTGSKTLPTIWGTYMKLVTKYQISAINRCWEKCDEKWFMCTVLNKNDVRNITSQFLFEKVFHFSNGCY